MAGQQGQPKYGFGWPDGHLGGLEPPEARPLVVPKTSAALLWDYYGEMNAKYQMQLRLRDLASPANPPKYPSIHINEDTLSTSMHQFSSYLKMKFVNSYPNMCNLEGCFVCLNLN